MIIKNERKAYPTDLTDSQWNLIAPLFPRPGNKSKWEKRELVDAVLYLVHNGCKWRNLPLTASLDSGEILLCGDKKRAHAEKIQKALIAHSRTAAGRNPQPTYGIIDSQSIKTSSSG